MKNTNEMEIRFESRSANEGFARVAVASFLTQLNPDSLKVCDCWIEPALANCKPGDKVQFERTGYFCVDPDSSADKMVFNRTVTLKDSWAKQQDVQK